MKAKKKASSKKAVSGKKTAAKSTKKKAATTAGGKSAVKDFTAVFAALRGILSSYEGRLAPQERGSGYYYVESLEPTYKNRPMFFAGVKAGKNYISYHLLPLYMSPELNEKVSPELKKRMQGKACFNFATVDLALFKQLGTLTKVGYKAFKDRGWL